MANFVVDRKSGVPALVSAKSLEAAQSWWDSEVEEGWAESGTVRDPRPGEVELLEGVHDYR